MKVFNLEHGHVAANEESPKLRQLSRHAWAQAGGRERSAMGGVQASAECGGSRLVVARCGGLNHHDDDDDDADDDADDDYDYDERAKLERLAHNWRYKSCADI